jgi:hypothetical protein
MLLTPVLAGLVYLHVTPNWPFAVIADGVIGGGSAIIIGLRLMRNELNTDNQKLSGFVLIVLGSLSLLVISVLMFFVLFVALSGYEA